MPVFSTHKERSMRESGETACPGAAWLVGAECWVHFWDVMTEAFQEHKKGLSLVAHRQPRRNSLLRAGELQTC